MQYIMITGATGGIGSAIARNLARLGFGLVLHANKSIETAREFLSQSETPGIAVQSDLSLKEGPMKLWSTAIDEVGKISGLVNNAGLRSSVALDADLETWHSAWEADLQLNLKAPADLIRLSLPHFRNQGFGRIVNIASRAGQRGYADEHLAYGASKAGLLNITKSIARNHGKYGISCVAISPGFVRTQMADDFIHTHGVEAATGDIPIRKLVEPDEVAELVALCLRRSQASMNGATLDMNGGSYVR